MASGNRDRGGRRGSAHSGSKAKANVEYYKRVEKERLEREAKEKEGKGGSANESTAIEEQGHHSSRAFTGAKADPSQ